MERKTKIIAIAVYAAVMLIIVSCSYLMEPSGDDDDDQIVGTWHLVSKESLDQDQKYSRAIDEKYDIEVTAEYGYAFTAKTQGVEFTGIKVNGMVMFEYRHGDDAWIRADGRLENGILVMYETHYYNQDSWFVSISKYSKTNEKMKIALPDSPDVQTVWNLQDGRSHYYDGGSVEYELDGKRFFISNMWGNLFRAEMQQEVDGEVMTRLMNGVFISSFDDIHIAYLIDTSGKMWTLSIQDGLATLRSIVISEHAEGEGDDMVFLDVMVVVERTYYDTIPPEIPEAPYMVGTWTADGASGRYGDGSEMTWDESITIEYLWQEGYVFTGETVYLDVTLPEAGYIVYDKNAYNGWIVRIGTDTDGTFREGYVFMVNDDEMIMLEFVYDDGLNGVVTYTFIRQP